MLLVGVWAAAPVVGSLARAETTEPRGETQMSAGAESGAARRYACTPGISWSAARGKGVDVGFLTWPEHENALGAAVGQRGVARGDEMRRYVEAEWALLVAPHGDILAGIILGVGPYWDAAGADDDASRGRRRGLQATASIWAVPIPVVVFARLTAADLRAVHDREVGVMLKLPLTRWL